MHYPPPGKSGKSTLLVQKDGTYTQGGQTGTWRLEGSSLILVTGGHEYRMTLYRATKTMSDGYTDGESCEQVHP